MPSEVLPLNINVTRTMADRPFNAFEMAQKQFDAAADILGLDEATRDLSENSAHVR